jgi:hypothetical protein
MHMPELKELGENADAIRDAGTVASNFLKELLGKLTKANRGHLTLGKAPHVTAESHAHLAFCVTTSFPLDCWNSGGE